MSLQEIAKESPIFSYTFPNMAVGTIDNPVAMPNFSGACSQILGCVRVTAGGVVGQPYATFYKAGLSLFPVVTLSSSSAGDTSVYRIYWTNKTTSSQIASVLTC